MKRLLLLFFIFVGTPALAQTTNVSGTVVDSGGQVWLGSGTGPGVASYRFDFVPSPSNPQGPYFQSGVPFNTGQVFSGFLNGSGAFSGVAVPSNTSISPSGSTWKVTVCPQATFPCFQQNFTITGASQALTITPGPITVNVISQPSPRVVAYVDSEIINPSVGNQYYNSTDNTIHVCTAGGSPCNWVSITAGSNILPLNNTFTGNNNFPNLTSPTIGPSLAQQHTIPAVASDVLGLLAAPQTFTNKTLTSPTVTNPTTTGADSGAETLSNKSLTSPAITNPTTTGTDSGVETLASKTLTSPVMNGTPTGTALQGTDAKLMTAGAVSGIGSPLCTDTLGGSTTSGCPSGGVSEATWSSSTGSVGGGISGFTNEAQTVLPSAHTLIRFTIFVATTGLGCSTVPVVQFRDVTTSTSLASLTIANNVSLFDSGVISVSMTGGDVFGFFVATGSSGCSTAPNFATFTAVYK